MDFLDPAKRRQHNILLLIGYILVGVAIATFTYLLMLQSYGYGVDPRTGQVIQNGLVFVDSRPVSADVYVDNELKGDTNLRLIIPEGKHNFTLKSNGYHDWTTAITLAGGGVEQLTYPLLVPKQLTAKDVQLYAKPVALASQSIDRRWLLVLKADTTSEFDLYDLNSPDSLPEKIVLPANILTTSTGKKSMRAIEWANDNRHLLLEYTYKGGKDFIVLDRQDTAKSFNVNKLLDFAPTSVELRDKKFDQLYAYQRQTRSLFALNASNGQKSNLLKDVIDYKSYGNKNVLYTSPVSKVAGQYSVNIWDGKQSYLLHNYPANTPYRLDMKEYDNHLYVAVAPVSSNKLYVFKDPLSTMTAGRVPNPFIAIKINNPQYVSFSLNYRFILAQSGSRFASYDFENDLWHYFNLPDKIALNDQALWMDGYRLKMNIENKATIMEFNGGNRQSLTASQSGLSGFFDPSYKALYNLAPSVMVPNRSALTSTSMVVKR